MYNPTMAQNKAPHLTVVNQAANNGEVSGVSNEEVSGVSNGEVSDTTGLKGDKKTLAVSVSSKFEEAVNRWAVARDKSVAQIMREALAQFIDYDLSAEPIVARGKRSKYANKDEAQAAQKKKVAERNLLIRELLAKYRSEQENKG